MPNPLRCAILAIPTLLVLGGCDGSTAPHTVTAAQLARHIDSLSLQAGPTRASYLIFVEEAPAYGATPVSVNLSINSTNAVWQGYVWKVGAGPDSSFWIAAYSDYSFKTVLIARAGYNAQGQSSEAASMLDDTIAVGGGSGTVAASTTSLGSACAFVSGLHNYPFQQDTNCVSGTFQGNINWTFNPAAIGQPGTTVVLTAQRFNGVALQ